MTQSDTVAFWQTTSDSKETSQWVTGLQDQFEKASHIEDLPWQGDRGHLQTCLTPNSFWVVYNFATAGKLALRTCFDPNAIQSVKLRKKTASLAEYLIEASQGRYRVTIERGLKEPMLLRYTTRLEPRQAFTVQNFPRDLYLLDDAFNPTSTDGRVYVTQNGPTAGLAYGSLTQPMAGTFFYFQNLTALSDYCQQTRTDPSGSVTVQWPEGGFTLPASQQPLEAGTEVVVSDAFVYLSEAIPQTEFEAADLFLEALSGLYPRLPKPDTTYYDWPKAAKKTIQALTHSPECGRRIQNRFYVNAYVDAVSKPPESMVQLAILVPLWEYQAWLNETVPLVDQLQESFPTFYDEKKATLVRWLPGEDFEKTQPSEEEDHNMMDSWYLLHILMNLGRLAHQGNNQAKDLLLRSIDFVIRAAHHFEYNWPVFYDPNTLEVKKAETAEGQGGEFDVAGLYTHVMLQAYELTQQVRFLREAKQSADRLKGKGFELIYQSNITMMSALSLAKLWKLTGNRLYHDLSKLCVANVVAHLWIWECGFGFGQHRSTYMGVAPLRDAPYLAAYEEAEIFATMHNYLKEFDRDAPASIRLLFSEYMKYLLHRGRYYFPTELPPEMISLEPHEGRIIPELPIPLEDISTGWKLAGEVGQEVYGGALPYILTTYAYKRFEEVPVILYSEYPICESDYQVTDQDCGFAVYRLGGTAAGRCRIRLIAKGRQLPPVRLFQEDGDPANAFKPLQADKTYLEYEVHGNLRLRVEWSKKGQGNKSKAVA